MRQIRQLMDSLKKKKEYCSADLLDLAQTFVKVWHPDFLYKLINILFPTYCLFFKSYFENLYNDPYKLLHNESRF